MQELCFLVDNFIMIGSPAGLFTALRGVNPSKGRPLGSPAAGMLYPGCAPGGLPVCRRMYNVFHPFDPVAYRLEPLIQKAGCPRPQLVPYHRGGRKLKMNIVDAGENVAKTMDKVAAAFTFSFRRSKEETSEPVRRPPPRKQAAACGRCTSPLGWLVARCMLRCTCLPVWPVRAFQRRRSSCSRRRRQTATAAAGPTFC